MATDKREKKRIWVDGCFDGFHFGHSNMLRQAREMGDYLVVGVHSDREILKNKGPTLCNDDERYAAVAACKWVDKVVQDAPYLTSLEWLDLYDCDFCVHGDDVTTMSDGTDCYSIVKAAGRYKECKRTEGVSTTDLLSSILDRKYLIETRDNDAFPQTTPAEVKDAVYTQRMLDSFSADLLDRKPSEESRIVYVCGSWDLFHSGHSDFFKQAKAHGSHLIVGIHSDATIHSQTSLYPIQEMRERALSVLSCRHVDGFVLDCPLLPDMAFMAKYNISAFCHGETEMKSLVPSLEKAIYIPDTRLNNAWLLERVWSQHDLYTERQRKKGVKSTREEEMKREQQDNKDIM